LVLFKGFGITNRKAPYLALLENVPHITFDVSDDGVDINAYMKVAEQYDEQYRYFCFLNSHSVIMDDDWLTKLYNNIVRDDVGLVGSDWLVAESLGLAVLFGNDTRSCVVL